MMAAIPVQSLVAIFCGLVATIVGHDVPKTEGENTLTDLVPPSLFLGNIRAHRRHGSGEMDEVRTDPNNTSDVTEDQITPSPLANCTSSVTENAKCTSPVTENANRTSPVTENANRTSPVTENANCTSPVTENANCSSPVTENANCTSPVTENANCTSPVTENALRKRDSEVVTPPSEGSQTLGEKLLHINLKHVNVLRVLFGDRLRQGRQSVRPNGTTTARKRRFDRIASGLIG